MLETNLFTDTTDITVEARFLAGTSVEPSVMDLGIDLLRITKASLLLSLCLSLFTTIQDLNSKMHDCKARDETEVECRQTGNWKQTEPTETKVLYIK